MEGVTCLRYFSTFIAFLGLCEEYEAARGDDQVGSARSKRRRGGAGANQKYFPARANTPPMLYAFYLFPSGAASVSYTKIAFEVDDQICVENRGCWQHTTYALRVLWW